MFSTSVSVAFAWFSVLAVVSGECTEGGVDGDCLVPNDSDVSGLYQLRTQRVKIQSHVADSAIQQKTNILEESFKRVKGQGTYFDPTTPTTPTEFVDEAFANVDGYGKFWPSDVKLDATWRHCTDINWTKVKHANGDGKLSIPSVGNMFDELRINTCYESNNKWYEDDTCKAIRALINASIEMETMFKEGPKFANYSVVSWGRMPSWVVGAVSDLDYSDPLPIRVPLHSASGVLGYGLCDIVRTVLTQSANQMSSGTCSYVASLAAISHKAPAIALKLGTRLLWTGEITADMGPACPAIYHQQPGLVPFFDRGEWRPPFFGGDLSSVCTGSDIDCLAAKGRPSQNTGLTLMWSQTLISNWMSKNWGNCANGTTRSGLTYPGQSKGEAAIATRNQGGWYNSMMWSCDRVIDPVGGSCSLLINPNTCNDILYDDCVEKLKREPAEELTRERITPLVSKLTGEAWSRGLITPAEETAWLLPKITSEFQNQPHLLEYTQLIERLGHKYDKSIWEINDIQGPPYPSFTEELLEMTCDSFVNMLIIDATVLSFTLSLPFQAADLKRKHLPFFGNFVSGSGEVYPKSKGCNHAVYLEKCNWETNDFTIWTWGTTVNLTKEMILGWPTDQPYAPPTKGSYTWNTGSVCGSIVADRITVK